MNALVDRSLAANIQEWRRRVMARILRRWLYRSESSLRRDGSLDISRVRRILISRPNHRLGNLVLLTPLVVELGRLMPQARIDIVAAGDDAREIFGAFHNVQAVHSLSKRAIRHPLALIRTIRQLRRGDYDLVIDPCEMSQSGRALLVLTRAPQAIGLPNAMAGDAGARKRLLHDAPAHFAHLPVFLLRNALPACEVRDVSGYPPLEIALNRAERSAAQRVLDALVPASPPKTILGVFTGATGSKRYSSAWWTCLLAAITQQQPDWSIVEILAPGADSTVIPDLPRYASSSVRQVAALISCMDAFVCADSGVMHLASASGTTTLGLFSQTDPRKYAPFGGFNRGLDTRHRTPEQVADLVVASVVETLDSAAVRHVHRDEYVVGRRQAAVLP